MSTRLPLVALLCSFSMFAAEPAAILTAGADVKVNGKLLPTAGAPNWPLETGDEIITGSAAAALTFHEGARLTLAPGTRVVLKKCDTCLVQLFQGSTDYVKPKGSKLEICALGHPVRPIEETQGAVLIQPKDKVIVRVASAERVVTTGSCPCGGMPIILPIAVVAGAGVAAAVAVATSEDASKK